MTTTGAGGSRRAGATSVRTLADFLKVCQKSALSTAFLFALIFGASCFSVVLRGYGGDEVIAEILQSVPLPMAGKLALIIAILMAICLQTSFLTPPVGMALFYLKNAVKDVQIRDIYMGVIPFVAIQLATLLLVALWPALVLWQFD